MIITSHNQFLFLSRPLGLPILRKVRVRNLNSESSIEMLSISGNTFHFHCSFFTDKVRTVTVLRVVQPTHLHSAYVFLWPLTPPLHLVASYCSSSGNNYIQYMAVSRTWYQ